MMHAMASLSDAAFREMLPCCLTAVQGPIKELDCLSLIRQGHDQRYRHLAAYEWLTNPAWGPSYQSFCRQIAEALARQDRIAIDQAQQRVRDAFWPYLAGYLREHVAPPSRRPGSRLLSQWRDAARRVPGVREAWRRLRDAMPRGRDEVSLPAFWRPSSRYHEEFMPVYRAVTAPPMETESLSEREAEGFRQDDEAVAVNAVPGG